MIALIIDTSSDFALIALAKEGVIFSSKTLPDAKQLSKYLLPSIQALLQEVRVDYIAAGMGPGSFTGTRIGLAIAKSLAYAWQIPFIGFSSEMLPDLEAIAKFSNDKFSLSA